ncbi:MAG TPA: thiol peroxidase [Polyangia bacterium]|jgi:thiol peroxidase
MAQRTVKFGGSPRPVAGEELKVGQKAPDFALVANDLSPVTLKDTTGQVRIVAAVPSLDTGVCDRETRRFNQEAAKLPGVEVYTVSADLPFAQKRWCGAAGIDRVHTLSDHRAATFERWGVLFPDLRLLARATFVLDRDDVVRYAEYLPDVGQEPSYDAALAAAKKLL